MIRALLALVMVAHAGGWWSHWCERNLVADDPYQYETYQPLELVDAWWAVRPPPKVLRNEIVRRLKRGDLDPETYEILLKTLEQR